MPKTKRHNNIKKLKMSFKAKFRKLVKKINISIKHKKRRRPHRSVKLVKPYYILASSIFLILLIMQTGIILINRLNNGSLILGARLEGKTVMSLSPFHQPGKQYIESAIALTENKKIQIKSPDFETDITPAEVGLTYDRKTILEQLFRYGRNDSFLESVWHQDLSFLRLTKLEIKPTAIKQKEFTAFITNINTKITKKPQNAYYVYKDGDLKIVAEIPGLMVDDQTVTNDFSGLASIDHPVYLIPIIKTEPEINTYDLQKVLPQAENITLFPIDLLAQNQKMTLTSEQLVSTLSITKDPKSKLVKLSIDDNKVNEFINNLKKKTEIPMSPTISDGEQIVDSGKPGLALSPNSNKLVADYMLKRESNKEFANSNRSIFLSVNTVNPTLIVRKPKVIQLTIDDAPNASTAQILDILKQNGVHATFFVIGASANNSPDLIQRMVAEGHVLGNHSYSHPQLASLSADQVREELNKCQEAVKAITGITMTIWRPPYISHNSTTDAVASSLGLRIVLFNDNPNDSTSNPGPKIIAQRVINAARPDGIVILHSQPQTLAALPEIISGLRAKGYRLK